MKLWEEFSNKNWTFIIFFSDPRDFQEVNNIPVLVNQLSGAVSRITQLSKAAAGFQYLLNSPFATGN